MDLGRMLREALEREGIRPPVGSGMAEQALQDAAESFLAEVRKAEHDEAASAAENNPPAALYGNVE